MAPVEIGQRMQEKAALGRGLRALEQDQPGLITLPRLRDPFAAGEISSKSTRAESIDCSGVRSRRTGARKK